MNNHSDRILQGIVALITIAACSVIHADSGDSVHTHFIEAFVSSDTNISGANELNRYQEHIGLEVKIYRLDAIQQIQSELSRDLASDPEQAKSVVMERIQHLNADARSEIQNAATGMAKAMQYGIDRLPAVVVDGQAVVYGVTDLHVVLGHYATWQAGK